MSMLLLQLTMKKGQRPVRGEDHYWSVMLEKSRTGTAFTARDIFEQSNANMDTIREFIKRLVKAGFLAKAGTLPNKAETFSVAKVQAATPRVRRDGTVIETVTATQCMWNAIRNTFRTGFTVADLVRWASTDDTRITTRFAAAYIDHLNKSGYLIPLMTDGMAGGEAMWKLDPSKNTGPLTPMILRAKIVFDQNRNEVVGGAPAEELL
ncbi:hypothetical protein GGQ73_003215 [Rhizobium skierniewicense]|uniref:Uncharacterized protein n=1 Tax=Rhizobium skierniewicense TaxID=984260 RepID=A0A7W6CD47_9HYPH|nr:hypothetical protein [Rhizobium skierniewicense]MBB3947249.1 hypothetical protein [Rhizobium skierniewicense]